MNPRALPFGAGADAGSPPPMGKQVCKPESGRGMRCCPTTVFTIAAFNSPAGTPVEHLLHLFAVEMDVTGAAESRGYMSIKHIGQLML